MKNKSAVLSSLALMVCLASAVYAASGVRGAKPAKTIAQTTNVIGISSGPAVLYSVIMSTGGTYDFIALFDSNSAVGLSSVLETSGSGFRTRLYSTNFSSAGVMYNFDPPIQFVNGIMAVQSAAGLTSMITYEAGRVTQGY